MITVLYLNGARFVGGAQVTLRNIVRRLDSSRFRAIVVIAETDVSLRSYLASAGVQSISVPMRPLNPLTPSAVAGFVETVRRLRSVVNECDVRIIHGNSQRSGPIGIAVKRVSRARFVWTINDVGVGLPVRLLIPHADAITCVSDVVRRRMPASVDARLIYNGVVVDEDVRRAAAFVRAEGRRAAGIPQDAFVVGSVTRLEYWKGVHNCAEVMRRVRLLEPSAWFVHVGGEPVPSDGYGTRLMASVAGQRQFFFAGFQEDPHRWYPIFDAFLHMPLVVRGGHTESFGMNVAEAMGYRLPVIATAVGAMPELVEDGQTGILVAENDIDGAVAAVCRLMHDRVLSRSIGHAARLRQQALFTQQREVDDFQRLYEELSDAPSA